MTREIHVPHDVFARVREHLTERHVVELTATIAAYNCVSRFLEALRIDPEHSRTMRTVPSPGAMN